MASSSSTRNQREIERENKRILTYVVQMIEQSRKSMSPLKEDTAEFWKNFKKNTKLSESFVYYRNQFFEYLLPNLLEMPITDVDKVSIYYSLKYPIEEDELNEFQNRFSIILDDTNDTILWYADPAKPDRFADETDEMMWDYMIEAAKERDFWKKRNRVHWERFRTQTGCQLSADSLARRFERVLMPNIHLMPFNLDRKIEAYYRLRVEVHSSIMADLICDSRVKLNANGFIEEYNEAETPQTNRTKGQSGNVSNPIEANVKAKNAVTDVDEPVVKKAKITPPVEPRTDEMQERIRVKVVNPVEENMDDPKKLLTFITMQVLAEKSDSELAELATQGEEFKKQLRGLIDRNCSGQMNSVDYWIEEFRRVGEGLRKADEIKIKEMSGKANKELNELVSKMCEEKVRQTAEPANL